MIGHSYKDGSLLKYKCDECDFWGPNITTMEMHFLKLHSETLVCGLCDYEAKDVEVLDTHTFTCEMFKCSRCKQKFKTLQDIKNHVNKDHEGNHLPIFHYYCTRGNQEFFEEKFHLSKELFRKN